MFLTYNAINFNSMNSVLADTWHPLGGVTITNIGGKRFLFRFYNRVDFYRVVEGIPWSFNRHLLVWSTIENGQDPLHVPLLFVNVWVHVKGLRQGFFHEEVAKSLGNFIDSYVTYDLKYNSQPHETILRIRSQLDVRQPLRTKKKLVDTKGEAFYAKFSYDWIHVFCYLCGLIGHTDSYCEQRLHKKLEELCFEWNDSLRVSNRRVTSFGSQWLKEEENSGSTQLLSGRMNAVPANDIAKLDSQLFRQSLFGVHSNSNKDGVDEEIMKTDSMGRMSMGDLGKDVDKTTSPSVISIDKDLIGGSIVRGSSSMSKTAADLAMRDSRHP
ncbi:hypothetical protein K2173_007830 [Erythroxylum novogranatense]|uniref:DUF4283 domain-containing protein n=1 Tax=Erythroxylum novogranatense TaxID=1862640 RepID=A0AAV8TKJ9_9ROSI|nr:hypothetical protein K2173_007830 [Erythroxylum novogranatense]